MVVDLIGIYGLKGPYRTLTTTNWFLQALSVIPRGSWGDVARRSYHDPMEAAAPSPQPHAAVRRSPPPPLRRKIVPANLDEENPSAPISSGLLVQADEGIPSPVVDPIDDIYRRLP
ncbi:dynein alpha chain, flagellar outer arm [Dorcoceras hygrometricum]|uniref:Dynein alpha chain, flagellar outer arm n=1 Tax=Dorcoceras hygrometricum TaxID=472368 RepID=A0A2Z7BAI4_9LAMI|nr:dynein alpha chain, flagellar outer arm [Dorcoceras hygrometricum]